MTNSSIKKFAFILGRERELCLAELKAVLSFFCFDFDITSVSNNVVFINIEEGRADLAAQLIGRLGGVTKIFSLIGDREKDLSAQISLLLDQVQEGRKINFGISSYANDLNENAVNVLGLKVKKSISKKRSVRFVALRGDKELSTIVSSKQISQKQGLEFGVFNEELGVLCAVSNPEPWSERDYDKPAGDKYSGMLPPKLARIMINLAIGQLSIIKYQGSINNQVLKDSILDNCNLKNDTCDNVIIADPFCGSGNVLMEGLMLGCDVFGSDISEKPVKDSQENITWLNSRSNSDTKAPKFAVTKADATSDDFAKLLNTKLQNTGKHLAVVTEPFLGEPKKFKPTMNAARGEYRKIQKLYLDFFKNFAAFKTFSPIVLCVVFPLVETQEGKRFSLYQDSVDEIRKIGYTEVQSPLIYGRDYQVVKREILLLTLN